MADNINTVYVPYDELTQLQYSIMKIVDNWVRTEKKPIPQKVIITKMQEEHIHKMSTINALRSLMKRGYIRQAVVISNKTFYVQCRGI